MKEEKIDTKTTLILMPLSFASSTKFLKKSRGIWGKSGKLENILDFCLLGYADDIYVKSKYFACIYIISYYHNFSLNFIHTYFWQSNFMKMLNLVYLRKGAYSNYDVFSYWVLLFPMSK